MTEIARRAGHSSVAFTLDQYGHLFPEVDTELSGRLSGLYEAPKLAVVPSIKPKETSARPTCGRREHRVFVGRQNEPLVRGL
jgi:hypothetical protein